jgi:hypothetical protein
MKLGKNSRISRWIERAFFRDITYADGPRVLRISPVKIIITLAACGAFACILLSGWTCAGCEKKPLNVRDIRGVTR